MTRNLTEKLNRLEIKENINTVKFNYTWSIDKTSLYQKETGEVIKSSKMIVDMFTDKVNCYLLLYPKGITKTCKDYLSIYYDFKTNKKKDINAECILSILNSRKEKMFEKSVNKKFTQADNLWGYPCFIARNFLLDNKDKLLPNDKLTFFCEVTVTLTSLIMIQPPQRKMTDELGILLENQKFSDVTLYVADKKFQAHKVILAACSPVFAAMFEHNMKESKQNKVNITDVDSDVIQEMLNFIYTDKADSIEKMADRLLVAADKYGLEKLKLICEEVLCNKLAIDNVVENLILADMHNANQLKVKAIDIISTYAKGVLETFSWKSMIEYPHLMAEIYKALTNQ